MPKLTGLLNTVGRTESCSCSWKENPISPFPTLSVARQHRAKNRAAASARPCPGPAAMVRSRFDLFERYLKNAALLRILARIVGCEYDDLARREQRRRRRRRIAWSAAVSAVTLVLGGFAYQAEVSRRNALQEKLFALAERSSQATQSGDVTRGLKLALEAIEQADRPPPEFLISRLREAALLQREEKILEGHVGPLDLGEPGRRESLRCWLPGWFGPAVGRRRQPCSDAGRAPGGCRLLRLLARRGVLVAMTSRGWYGARFWDAATSDPLAVLEGHDVSLVSQITRRTARRLVTGSGDDTARIWTRASTPLRTLSGHSGRRRGRSVSTRMATQSRPRLQTARYGFGMLPVGRPSRSCVSTTTW